MDIIIEHFERIKETHINICSIFNDINDKLAYLNGLYLNIVKTHSLKEYTFGLDSFHFQHKFIEVEHNNNNNLLKIISNRFYCEYYKLYKYVEHYIVNELHLNDKIIKHVNFPVYKDLDKNANYDFSLTIDVQQTIVKYINELSTHLSLKVKDLNDNTIQSKIGIHIENIINYQQYSNALIHERMMMFIRYLDALNKQHTKYINRLYNNSKTLLDQINEDITISNTDDVEAEEPNVVVEEPVAKEEAVIVVEEPVIIVEESVIIVEESIVEEKEVIVVEESIVEESIVEEKEVIIVEEPVIVAEEPVVIVEEPIIVVEEPVIVVEEPVIVEEAPVIVEEKEVIVVEELVIVVEEPVIVVEEPVIIVEEPAIIVEEQGSTPIEILCNSVNEYEQE
jgi:hypothetical protein